MPELWQMDAAGLAKAVRDGDASAREIVDAHIARIEAVEPDVHAFITLTPEVARAQADEVDRKRAAGETLGPLAGVPTALKDIFCTDGIKTTAGSRILESYIPPYDATATIRAREAGMPLLGKTNQDEFAMGSSTENSAFGVSRNPWDLARVPGGSSGGSSAAVAAGMAPITYGTDTGGSIRQPASLCGVVGVRPTYGLVSRYGIIAFASSLDQVGPFARTVRDAAAATYAVAGHDPRDSTSIAQPVPDYLATLENGVTGLRVGVVKEGMGEGAQPAVKARVQEAADRFAGMGCSVDEVSLPSFDLALSAYYLIAPAECSSNLARYDGVRYGHRADDPRDVMDMNMRSRAYGFGDEVKRRIMLGTYALSAGYYDAYYGKAQKVRTLVIRDFDQAYEKFDFLICPTSPTTAFKIGERTDDPLAMYLSDLFTIPTNLAGSCGISVPCGLADDGLPVGLQLLGPPLSEELLFRAGYAFEQDLGPLPAPPLWESR